MKGVLRCLCAVWVVSGLAGAAEQAGPNSLTQDQIGEGWILLFDGETTFGWKTDGAVKAAEGKLVLAPGASIETTSEFSSLALAFECKGKGGDIVLNGEKYDLPNSENAWLAGDIRVEANRGGYRVSRSFKPADSAGEAKPSKTNLRGRSRTTIKFKATADASLELRGVRLKPFGLKSIFNGKDLTGWKVLPGHKSVFTVTDKGEINVKDGNGDLQSEGQWADFILQLDVFSNGKHLNSGVFFRSNPGEFWQGYEAQIRNQWEGDDRTKPVDFGTGGIYNLQKSRKVVSNDKEWFTYTIAANGPHIALWVNGYQTADHVDMREPSNTARKGRRLGKGCVTLQGHDPTTDLSFRNIRVSELPEAGK